MQIFIQKRYPRYILKFLTNAENLESIYRFRGACFFNDPSFIDKDNFDEVSTHLLIEDTVTKKAAGYYRLLPYFQSHLQGFYSETEFVIPEQFFRNTTYCEIGRACIGAEYRNTSVLLLLFAGLLKFIVDNQMQGFFGCASINNNINVYRQVYDYALEHNLFAEKQYFAYSKTRFQSEISESVLNSESSTIPVLFKSYFKAGAKIMSDAYLDRAFNSIDFLLYLTIDRENGFVNQLLKITNGFEQVNESAYIW